LQGKSAKSIPILARRCIEKDPGIDENKTGGITSNKIDNSSETSWSDRSNPR
jgi:hypothetical protein